MTSIQIERLTTETQIYLNELSWSGMTAPFHGCAFVDAIEFDGYGYALTLGDERHYVDAGEAVTFGGVGEPVLRPLADVSVDELDAKFEADMAATSSMISEANAKCADMRGETLIAAE